MDTTNARILTTALKEHLKTFEEENEIKVTIGRGKYTDTTLTLSIELAELAESGEALTRNANEFKLMAHLYGLKPDDLGKPFTDGNRNFKIVGLKTRSTRYPIIAECNGRRYKFAAASVRLYLQSSVVPE